MKTRRVTIETLNSMKEDRERIAMLTAYDFYTAKQLDSAGVDILLVGDTVGMALGGMETTLGVRLDHILYHSEMVGRGAQRAMIVGDMPFLTYQVTPNQAVENAGRLMQEGRVHAVKLEGGRTMVPVIKRILTAGIPVMGHLGLTPQSVHRFGGWQVQGKDEESADRVKRAAVALEEAGCFALVLEAIPAELAQQVTESLTIPTIGIGAGPHCDGQVLVTPDMLGVTGFRAKYVKQYADLEDVVSNAAKEYVGDVKSGKYPSDEHGY